MVGLTGGLAVVLTLELLYREKLPSPRQLIGCGVALGLALLSKASAVLLVGPIVFALASSCAKGDRALRGALRATGIVVGVTFTVAGWYYIRNWIVVGTPFIGGWDQSTTIGAWWQDPGYRMASQYLRFGESLTFPVYASIISFWDGLYSTFWLDGYLGGRAYLEGAPPWNFSFMLAGAWLALLPSLALILGVLRAIWMPGQRFVLVCVGLYAVALLFMHLRVPVYAITKATYMMAVSPCIVVLGASGFDLMSRQRVLRAVVVALFSTWAFSSYVSYFTV